MSKKLLSFYRDDKTVVAILAFHKYYSKDLAVLQRSTQNDFVSQFTDQVRLNETVGSYEHKISEKSNNNCVNAHSSYPFLLITAVYEQAAKCECCVGSSV